MLRVELGKLTPKGYRISVGFYLNNGTRTQRTFWLGHFKPAAEDKAIQISRLYETDSAHLDGKKIWSVEGLAAALRIAKGQTAVPNPAPTIPAPEPAPAPIQPPTPVRYSDTLPAAPTTVSTRLDPQIATLYQGIEAYKSELRKMEIGEETREHNLKRLGYLIDPKLYECGSHIKDRPLREIGTDELEEMRRTYTSRPVSKKTKEPISVITVRNQLQILHQLFDWLDRKRYWIGYHRWKDDQHFIITKKQFVSLHQPQERKHLGKAKPTFTILELRWLWHFATKLERQYLLCGLNFSWTQKPISLLQKSDPIIVGEDMYIEQARNKTGVQAKWWVWPETREVFRHCITNTPNHPDNLMFLSDNEFPVQHGNTDDVAQAWERLMYRVNRSANRVRKLGFGALRRFVPQATQNVCAGQVHQLNQAHQNAQKQLSHTMKGDSTSSVAATHYVSNEQDIGVGSTIQAVQVELQKRVYGEVIKQMFVKPEQKTEPAPLEVQAA